MGVVYAVAKYIPDLLRQEPRNVGVFVANEARATVRLVGDSGTGKLDRRRATQVKEDIDLYGEWFAFWTNLAGSIECGADSTAAEGLLRSVTEYDGDIFTVWPGGDYLTEEEDNIEAIADDLFERLVATGPEDVSSSKESAAEHTKLHRELKRAFVDAGILGDKRRRSQRVPHPILQNHEVRGTLDVPYRASFAQVNGHLTVMEDIDFGGVGEERIQNHALSTAFMFQDLMEAQDRGERVELIAVVHLHPDRNLYPQQVGMAALREVEGVKLVNWALPKQRETFLHERIAVAEGPSDLLHG